MTQILNSTKRLVLFLILLLAAATGRACNINISASATTICSGTQITFTGVTSNASYRITYQWEKNGVPMTGTGNSGSMGSNPPNTVPGDSTFTFTTDGFVDGDVVTCYITEPYANFTNTSSGITITVSNQSTVSSNFNGTSIASGNYIWFSSVLNVTGSPTYPMTIYFTHQSISSSAFTLAPPDGELILSNAYSTATTTYNGTTWITTAPPNQSGNYFISGYAHQLSSALSGGLNPVNWSGTYIASQSGVSLNWQWAAAVYTSFNSNLNNLGVKASDCSSCTPYSNSDHAGAPESYLSYVTGGARGGGGSNYTGSYSATGSITTCSAVTPTVTISGNTIICSGTSVTFTASSTNGGTSPTYQWKKNGNNVGSNSTTYTDNGLNNGDIITCVMTSSNPSAAPSTVTSNSLTMTVNSYVTPAVSISANPGTSVCSGTSVTFTATATNGGSTPSYQWKLNGNNVGSNSATYTNNSLNNSDVVSVVMTSNATCASPATANSSVTMTVNHVTPALSISGTTTICAGTSVTFTATPTNGGSTPSYQWKKNGNNVGTNSTTYTDNSLANNDVITCVMTSNATCASPTTATSNTLTMTVNANVTPSVSISANPGTSVCSGTSVTFTATATNGGSTPSYQWKLNGNNVGSNSATYTNSSLSNNDVVSVVMTSNATCASPTTANASVTMTVNSVTPALSISGTTTICAGTSVTFIATPTNGGSSPSYQWKKNGNNVGTNSTSYTDNSLANNDVITCVMTSNATCVSQSTATSNTLTMTVNSNLTPSVSISANPGTSVCSGTSVTFTATPTNGGSSPSYQWKKNGVNVGTNSATYSNSSLVNGDVVSVVMTSNASCASPAAASSSVTMTITSITPAVGISGTTTICSGTSVTFTATPANGGSSPSYQWKKNGNNVGTNSTTYTDNGLNNGDQIVCVMTSNATCATPSTATSNTLTMTVNSATAEPGNFTTSSSITYQGQTGVTFTVPNVAGVTYTWSYSGTGVTISGSGNSVSLNLSSTATSGSLCVTASTGGACGVSTPRCISITVKPYETWNCTTNNDWNTASNWDGGFVPYNTISVLIPSGVCNPNICSGNAYVNNITINSGAAVTICCSEELDVKGNFTNNGIVSGCGHVVITDSCHTIYGKGTVDNFEMRSGCSVCNTVINSGDTLHIGQSFMPTSGTLVTNGGLVLLSDSSNTAVILQHGNTCGNCNTYISGEVVCEKYIHGGRRAFRFLGHPFTSSIGLNELTPYIDITGQGGSANGFTTTATNNPSAFWYNTLTGNGSSVDDSTGWIPFTNTNGSGANAWKPFEGIRLLFRGSPGQGLGCNVCVPDAVTIKMHGPINECEEVVTCATNTNVGYNFIGNPYPSNIDLSLTTRGSAIGANFSVWDPNQGTEGAYVCQPFNFSYILPAYSAFFTTATSTSNNTITFHESDKTSAAPTGNLFKTTSGFGNNVVQLHILSNNDSLSWDRLLLFFNGQAMANLDALDNQKQFNPGLSFYTYSADASQLSVDMRPYVDGQVIQLGLQNATPMSYAIRVDDYDVPAGTTLYLHDKYLNQVQALSQGMHYNFTVTSDPASQGDNRFELNLSGATSVSNVIAGNNFKVNMVPNPATDNAVITFEAPVSGNTVIRISSITGQVLYTNTVGDVKSGKAVLPLQNFAPGLYIVNIVCGNYSMTQRLLKQ